jgi:hypothetical protein
MVSPNSTRIWIAALWIVLAFNSPLRGQNSRYQERPKWLLCSIDWIFTSYTARPDFTVKVASAGKPVSNLILLLEAEQSPTGSDPTASLARKTNADGVAEFTAIPRGKYWVRPDGLLRGSTEINIDPNSRKSDKITLEWPLTMITVRTVKGTVVSEKKSTPLEGVRVELLDVRNSTLLGDTYSDLDGRYEIDAPTEGSFALRLTPRGESVNHEEIGIEVRKQSANVELPAIRLENTDCGLQLSFLTEPLKH